MICPDCGHDNITGIDDCESCGQSLVEFDPSGSELEQAITGQSIRILNPKTPVTVDAGVSAKAAVDKMIQERIGCLLIEKDGQLVGVFTERDVLNKASSDPADLEKPVSTLMTPSPVTITADDSIAYALHAMDSGRYRHLAIVDENGKPSGIISVRDILRYLCDRFGEIPSPAG